MLKRILGIFNLAAHRHPKSSCRSFRDHHTVSRKQISASALKVLYRLNEAGYDAFLVGGSVKGSVTGRYAEGF